MVYIPEQFAAEEKKRQEATQEKRATPEQGAEALKKVDEDLAAAEGEINRCEEAFGRADAFAKKNPDSEFATKVVEGYAAKIDQARKRLAELSMQRDQLWKETGA